MSACARRRQEIAQSVLDQLNRMKTKPQFRGSIILMHDGGGDRTVTVAALPVLIDTLRAHGYTIVQVSALMGKTTAEVMPQLTFWQRVRDLAGFDCVLGTVDDLQLHRDGVLYRRHADERAADPGGDFRHHRSPAAAASRGFAGFNPRVAVLIPAYNEEKVIVRTIRSVLNSDYNNLRMIVIDDGSKDRTAEVAREAYAAEIRPGGCRCWRSPTAAKRRRSTLRWTAWTKRFMWASMRTR